jgi:hypothetical protein
MMEHNEGGRQTLDSSQRRKLLSCRKVAASEEYDTVGQDWMNPQGQGAMQGSLSQK